MKQSDRGSANLEEVKSGTDHQNEKKEGVLNFSNHEAEDEEQRFLKSSNSTPEQVECEHTCSEDSNEILIEDHADEDLIPEELSITQPVASEPKTGKSWTSFKGGRSHQRNQTLTGHALLVSASSPEKQTSSFIEWSFFCCSGSCAKKEPCIKQEDLNIQDRIRDALALFHDRYLGTEDPSSSAQPLCTL